MKRLTALALLGILLLAGLASPAAAEGDDAAVWLKKMIGAFTRVPLRLSWTGEMDFPLEGMQLQSTIVARQLIGDATHQRMQMDLTMVAPEGQMQTSLQVVYDGKYFWSESQMPAMGLRHVTRMSLSRVGELGGVAGIDLSALDPRKLLEALTRETEFRVEGREPGLVILSGKLKPGALGRMNLNQFPGLDAEELVLRLRIDEKQVLPRRMELLVAGKPFFTMNYDAIEFPGATELAQDTFSYTPPAGVEITDLDLQLEPEAPEAPGKS